MPSAYASPLIERLARSGRVADTQLEVTSLASSGGRTRAAVAASSERALPTSIRPRAMLIFDANIRHPDRKRCRMYDKQVLDDLFLPSQRQLALAAYTGLAAVRGLVALSAGDHRRGDLGSMSLLEAEQRTLTVLRRDAVCARLETLFADDDAVEFRVENSWRNAIFTHECGVQARLRVKRFHGENGEQYLSGAQLRLDVGDAPSMLEVTLGWAETEEGLLPYLVQVDDQGNVIWRMDLPARDAAATPDRSVAALPSAAEQLRRVRPAARTADEQTEDTESA